VSATHKQVADRLGVSTVAVACIREVMEGASDISQKVLEETEEADRIDQLVAAAQRLARYKGCHRAAEEITRDLVRRVG